MRLGIDEAGRGSLIGPLIVAGVVLDERAEKNLIERGVKDSKRLSPSRREEIFEYVIGEAVFVEIVSIGAPYIDAMNIDVLTRKAMRNIISDALRVADIEEILLDRVGRTFHYSKKIGKKDVKIIMEEKADVKHPVVSAASIVAKVYRDRCIAIIAERYGLRGSGYPSDRETLEWLKENIDKIPKWLIRSKWRTLKRLGLITTGESTLDKFMT